jgi:hypothetical protein
MPITVYGEVNPDHRRFLVARDALLWRYMDISKYLDLITTSKMWFTRVSEFRKIDPYEATLTEYDEDKTTKIVETTSKEELKAVLIQRGETGIAKLIDELPGKSIYFFQLLYLTRLPMVDMNAYTHSISCWHLNPTESDAMWALYAGRDAGIAIKSTVGRVTRLVTRICVLSGARLGKRWMPGDFRLTRALLSNGDSVNPTVADKPA